MELILRLALQQRAARCEEARAEQDEDDGHVEQEGPEFLRDVRKAGTARDDVAHEMEFPGQREEMRRRDDPIRIEGNRARRTTEDEAARDEQDHARGGDARVRRRPAKQHAHRADRQDVEYLHEQEGQQAARERHVAQEPQDRHAEDKGDGQAGAVRHEAHEDVPRRAFEQDLIELMREAQSRHHADRREREEHRPEEEQEALYLDVVVRTARVEEVAVRKADRAAEAVVRAARIALFSRIVEADELVERDLDIRGLRCVRVVVEDADVILRARIAVLLESPREIDDGDRLIAVEERRGVDRRVEHGRDLHVLRGVDAARELMAVGRVVEVDDDHARIVRDIAAEHGAENEADDGGDHQADLLIRHALPREQEAYLIS